MPADLRTAHWTVPATFGSGIGPTDESCKRTTQRIGTLNLIAPLGVFGFYPFNSQNRYKPHHQRLH